MTEPIKRLCIVPTPRGVGGPASFRLRFSQALQARGIDVCYDLDDFPYDAVLLISSTRQVGKLWRAKRRGIPIIQRLDGLNWMHKRVKFNLRYYLKAEYGNVLMNYSRKHLASRIIYQSEFVVRRWEQVFGPAPVPHDVIYNSVDLADFSPDGPAYPVGERLRILLVEGSFGGGHDIGLKLALDLAEELEDVHHLPAEVVVAGKVPEEVKEQWSAYATVPLLWQGIIPREDIPALDRSAHLYFSAELNAPCPNSVIEAMACGLPVVAYDTGSLAELVGEEAGRVVPFDGDPWKPDIPSIPPLAAAAAEVLGNLKQYQAGARARAEAHFGIEAMVSHYLEAISKACAPR